jgi:extracellular factor (EF) 3-hydroxypalmitic acid methyl ester biosynthesis protein
MSTALNGNGNGANGLFQQIKKKPEKPRVAGTASDIKENHVSFLTTEGMLLQGTPVRVSRFSAVFELYNPSIPPRSSEAINELKITLQSKVVYAGRAVIRSIVDAGTNVLCEAMLDESLSMDLNPCIAWQQEAELANEFKKFLGEWQKLYKVLPEFKDAVSDIKMFLIDLRLWLEQIELGIQSSSELDRARMERGIIEKLAPHIIPVIDTLFDKFERIAAGLTEESRPAHRSYIQRSLHGIVLCAPFANRTYHKPLGYPGDYEMVNMMIRDPQEGTSLFSKMFNVWLLQQGSAVAHRNRLTYLSSIIESEALRVSRTGKKARIFNFACGPAFEVQNFLGRSLLSNQAEFTLADFNGETLEYTRKAISNIEKRSGRKASVRFQKKAVHQVFKESLKPLISGSDEIREYDFIYCAGLFDYLNDQTCKQLIKIFYQWLAPDGLLLVTNVTPLTPNQGSMDLILDWHLIYRNAAQLEHLCSGIIPKESVTVRSDDTGVNVFMEARKSDDD